MKAHNPPNIPNWTFLSHKDCVEPFRIFSKYTPANPDDRQDITTAITPIQTFWSSEFVLAGAEEVSTATMDTPPKRIQRDSHCIPDSFLLSIATENNAVVKILS